MYYSLLVQPCYIAYIFYISLRVNASVFYGCHEYMPFSVSSVWKGDSADREKISWCDLILQVWWLFHLLLHWLWIGGKKVVPYRTCLLSDITVRRMVSDMLTLIHSVMMRIMKRGHHRWKLRMEKWQVWSEGNGRGWWPVYLLFPTHFWVTLSLNVENGLWPASSLTHSLMMAMTPLLRTVQSLQRNHKDHRRTIDW